MENTEGSEGTPTKISDSGYSNSCTNSQSQRSGSSKSRHSGSNSSGSSGYCGKNSSLTNSNEAIPQPLSKHKELKKKKSKNAVVTSSNSGESSMNCGGTRTSSSGSQECVTSEEENKNVPSPAIPTPSQQHDEVQENACLIVTTNHEPNATTTSREEESKAITPLLPLLKTGDTTSIPGSQGGKNTDDDIMCFSPAKPTSDSYYLSKSITTIVKNQYGTNIVGFSCVVSMRDGVVLYTNSSVNTSLGYPKEMWLGRSFIDFLHPKDRTTFTSHITSGVALPFSLQASKEADVRAPLFCRIRRYRGLRNGYGVIGYGVREREVCYTPFKLDFSFRDVRDQNENNGMYLIITAIPVESAYGGDAETRLFVDGFATRHNASGILNHVNSEAVGCLGYMPQDIIGRYIFDLYHPEDMPYLKEVYEIITKKENAFKSKPYRFCAQNGEYLTIETEWSSFINPWSRKLEFIVGQHKIINAPANIDVFQMSKSDITKIVPEETLKQRQIIQEDILKTLNEAFIKNFESERQMINNRRKDITVFMEGLTKLGATRSDDELRIEIPKEKSLSERDSVMLGEISPHHDYYDSKSSTGTPPSYNQLNYSENLHRFFESHPWTSYKGANSGVKALQHTENDQPSSTAYLHEYRRPLPQSRHVNNILPKNRQVPTVYDAVKYKPTHLTQELLNKHNSLMEKLLVKKHKEARSFSKAEEKEKEERKEKNHSKNFVANPMFRDPHGVKRPVSLSWDHEKGSHKLIKQTHASHPNLHHQCHQPSRLPFATSAMTPITTATINTPRINGNRNIGGIENVSAFTSINKSQNQNLPVHPIAVSAPCTAPVSMWPPFSMPPISRPTPMPRPTPVCPQSIGHMSTNTTYSGLYPAVYLIPAQQSTVPSESSGLPKSSDYSSVQYMMCPPTMFSTQPFVYSHVAMAYPPMLISSNHLPLANLIPTPAAIKPLDLPFDNYRQACQSTINKATVKPHTSVGETVGVNPNFPPRNNNFVTPRTTPADSQNTSLKAELGSGVGSHATISLPNPKISTAKNEIVPGGAKTMKSGKSNNQLEDLDESSYSSFLKTEASDSIGNGDSGGEFSKTGANTSSNSNATSSKISTFASPTEDGNEMNWEKTAQSDALFTSSGEKVQDKDEKPVRPVRKMQPSWNDSVCITSELIYRYQVASKNIDDVLKADKTALDIIDQPSMVNEQLSQLYIELQLEGLSSRLKLEEGMTSSGSEEEASQDKKKKGEYNNLVMIYEENAPLPSPTGT